MVKLQTSETLFCSWGLQHYLHLEVSILTQSCGRFPEMNDYVGYCPSLMGENKSNSFLPNFWSYDVEIRKTSQKLRHTIQVLGWRYKARGQTVRKWACHSWELDPGNKRCTHMHWDGTLSDIYEFRSTKVASMNEV